MADIGAAAVVPAVGAGEGAAAPYTGTPAVVPDMVVPVIGEASDAVGLAAGAAAAAGLWLSEMPVPMLGMTDPAVGDGVATAGAGAAAAGVATAASVATGVSAATGAGAGAAGVATSAGVGVGVGVGTGVSATGAGAGAAGVAVSAAVVGDGEGRGVEASGAEVSGEADGSGAAAVAVGLGEVAMTEALAVGEETGVGDVTGGRGMLSSSPVAESRVAIDLAAWTVLVLATVVPRAGALTVIG